MLVFLMECALGVNLYYQFNILLIIISLLSPVFLRVKMHHRASIMLINEISNNILKRKQKKCK